MTTTNAPLAATAGLALGLGKGRTLVAVADYAEASWLYRRLCDELLARTGKGASAMKEGLVYDMTGTTPRVVARVSYNGKVWGPKRWVPGDEPLHNPYAAAALEDGASRGHPGLGGARMSPAEKVERARALLSDALALAREVMLAGYESDRMVAGSDAEEAADLIHDASMQLAAAKRGWL